MKDSLGTNSINTMGTGCIYCVLLGGGGEYKGPSGLGLLMNCATLLEGIYSEGPSSYNVW